jgi:hypothetical protein
MMLVVDKKERAINNVNREREREKEEKCEEAEIVV